VKRTERWIWITACSAALVYATRDEFGPLVSRGLDALSAPPAPAGSAAEPPAPAESEVDAVLAALERIGTARQEAIEALLALTARDHRDPEPRAGDGGAR
jgi:hypothetical protein